MDGSHALLADMLYAAHEYKDSVDEYRLAMAGRPDDATLKRGLDRARKKIVADKPARPRAKARTAKAAPSDDAPAEGGDDAGKTAAPPRRQRRPSRLPTSSSNCIASARSPSIFSRPSSSVCMGAIVPARTPSNVAPSMRMVVRGRPALTPALPKPMSTAQRRRRRPSISNASRPEICFTRSTSLASANRRSRVDHSGGQQDGQIRVRRAQRDAQVRDRLADPDVGRLPSRGTDRQRRTVGVDLPRPAPRARDADADHRRPRRRALTRRRERFRQPAFE